MDRNHLRELLGNCLSEMMDRRDLDLNDSTTLKDGLGLDSVDFLDLLFQVENRLGIRIQRDHSRSIPIETVGDVLNLLESEFRRPGRAAA